MESKTGLLRDGGGAQILGVRIPGKGAGIQEDEGRILPRGRKARIWDLGRTKFPGTEIQESKEAVPGRRVSRGQGQNCQKTGDGGRRRVY